MNVDPERPSRTSSWLILGIGIILLGVILLLEQVHGHSQVLDFAINLWPLILVAMGVAKLRPGQDRHPARGWVLIVTGLILLVATLGDNGFEGLIGPVLIVGAGILILLKALRKHRPAVPALEPSEDYIRSTAVLSGFKNRIHSQAFQGGELNAIFGGFELDLRPVVMKEDTARVDVFVLLGGGEIRIPEEWDVTVQVTTIAGGVGDKTPPPSASGQRPRLILTGMVLFGGIEIRN